MTCPGCGGSHAHMASTNHPVEWPQSEIDCLTRALRAERERSEELRAQLHGLQDGALLRDEMARRERAGAALATAEKRHAELVRDFNALDGCWEKKLATAQAEAAVLREVLEFYASPDTYFAIGILPDPPCGDFADDFSETERESDGCVKLYAGKHAREVLASDAGRALADAVRELVAAAACISVEPEYDYADFVDERKRLAAALAAPALAAFKP